MTTLLTTLWTHRHLGLLTEDPGTTAPVIRDWAGPRVLPQDDVGDMGPAQEQDGPPAVIQGLELWRALAAPAPGHPEERPDAPRIRLLATADPRRWTDLGNA